MPQTLLDWLVKNYPTAKRQTFKRMLEAGRISVNGQPPRSLRHELTETDAVVVSDRKQDQPKTTLPFPIIHEDDDVLVIDKPAGLLTSTVPREPRPTALAAVEKYILTHDARATVGLIHRLDRDASGLLVFTKTNRAFRSLKTQFFRHTVDRIYTAIVRGHPNPPGGRIESNLLERADGIVRSTRQPGKGQKAITEYQTLDSAKTHTLLQVTLHTGRKHQIRTHLAGKGSPILNDPLYGEEKPTGRLMLVARQLAFDHPRTGRRLAFRIDLPPEMLDLYPEANLR